MKPIPALLFLLFILLLAACTSTPAEVSNIQDYKAYIAGLDEFLRRADAESFAENERAELTTLVIEINGTIAEADTITDLNTEQQANLLALHNALHEKMMDIEEMRGSERICRTETQTSSYIGKRVCRTRDQLTQQRIAAQEILRANNTARDNTFVEDTFRRERHPFDRRGDF